jgi:protease I
MAELQGKRIAFLVANEGVEQVELTEPWKAVERRARRPS